MSEPAYAVLLVYSTSHAVRLETLLAERAIPCKMIPVPRHIGSDCGVCVRVTYSDVTVARQTAETAGIHLQDIVKMCGR